MIRGFAYLTVILTAALTGTVAATLAPGLPPIPGGKGAVKVSGPGDGILSDQFLGEYLTIEGVKAEGGFKVGERTLLVDTVNGKKLAKPVSIWVENLDLPSKKRCVLKGYETGEMIGMPPAVCETAKEQGKKFDAVPQAAWQWRAYFVVLVVTAPKDLRIRASWWGFH